MLTVLVILAVLGILFGAAVLATYEGEVLKDSHPDDRGATLPPSQLQPEDVAELRFDLALRGYRMSEVDAVMERLANELAGRDARITQLEQALVDLVEPAVSAAEESLASAQVDMAAAAVEQTPDEEELLPAVEAYEPLEPPAAAPAAISGPLTATTWFTEPAPVPAEEPAPTAVPAESPAAPDAFAWGDTAEEPAEQTEVLGPPGTSTWRDSAALTDSAALPDSATWTDSAAWTDSATWTDSAAWTDSADAAVGQADVPEAPAVSAPLDTADATVEEPHGEEPPPDPESLTLPVGDDVFSFPELHPPEPAAPAEDAAEEPDEWRAAEADRPDRP